MTDRSNSSPIATLYGYPRQGADRQLKKVTEAYWAGRVNADELLASTREAGVTTRPVILGPVSFLLLAKAESGASAGFAPLELLDRLLPCYVKLLQETRAAGAEWVQFDEPVLVMDQSPELLERIGRVYKVLGSEADRPKILVASYFDQLGDALAMLAAAPIDGLAMDFKDLPREISLRSPRSAGCLVSVLSRELSMAATFGPLI